LTSDKSDARTAWLAGLKPGDPVAVIAAGVIDDRVSLRVVDRLTATTAIVSVGGYSIRQERFRLADGIEISSGTHRDELHPPDSEPVLAGLARQAYDRMIYNAERRQRERRQRTKQAGPSELLIAIADIELDLAKTKAAINEWESRYA
jgi:hypothetical protein